MHTSFSLSGQMGYEKFFNYFSSIYSYVNVNLYCGLPYPRGSRFEHQDVYTLSNDAFTQVHVSTQSYSRGHDYNKLNLHYLSILPIKWKVFWPKKIFLKNAKIYFLQRERATIFEQTQILFSWECFMSRFC